MVIQVLHDLTYVAIVCHIGNPRRIESVSIVDFQKLLADPLTTVLGFFFWGGGLTIVDLL